MDIFEFVFSPLAEQSALKHGVPPDLFVSLIRSESAFNPDAYNKSGAAGIAQFMPGTAREMDIDPYDYTSALDAAAFYLKKHFNKYGNWKDAISQYKGYGKNLSDGYDKAEKVIADSGLALSPLTPDEKLDALGIGSIEQLRSGANNTPIPAPSEKALWEYNTKDWKDLFQRSSLTVLFGAIGVFIIFLSVWNAYKNRGA